MFLRLHGLDLIDTLWNVKDFYRTLIFTQFRFNRYIVECKDVHSDRQRYMMIDLIDTLWNVKFSVLILLLSVFLDLIDTLWNVKDGQYVRTNGER